MSDAYAKAGVDVEAGYEVVRRIGKHVESTKRPGVMGGLGGFGGMFDLGALNMKDPVLVSGTDGVGTKLMIAQGAGIHNTIGIDCVAMCVNDIVAQGAQPLYFLDYVAVGRNDPAQVEQIVAGVADGCRQAGAALIGGETAEMPDMYSPDEYDLAGFAVGAAERSELIDSGTIQADDILIGLSSSGLHSNGFSLVRKILFQDNQYSLSDVVPELCDDKTLGEVLLEPTSIYVKAVMPLVKLGLVRGIAHITGGGFDENIPRMLPQGLSASIQLGSWPVPAIFSFLRDKSGMDALEMLQVFNMGVGMVLAVRPEDAATVQQMALESGQEAWTIGEVVAGADAPVVYQGSLEDAVLGLAVNEPECD